MTINMVSFKGLMSRVCSTVGLVTVNGITVLANTLQSIFVNGVEPPSVVLGTLSGTCMLVLATTRYSYVIGAVNDLDGAVNEYANRGWSDGLSAEDRAVLQRELYRSLILLAGALGFNLVLIFDSAMMGDPTSQEAAARLNYLTLTLGMDALDLYFRLESEDWTEWGVCLEPDELDEMEAQLGAVDAPAQG